jgi:S-adenosylmethionine-diacylglycerol 3-amino-3-carboxypropyl transferase
VYNQVWEDYEVDRVALDIGADDVVLMITSGGCNVLNLLTEAPRRIVTIDRRAEQRDLLADKIDFIARGDYDALWHAYGVPAQRDGRSIYARGSYGRFAWVRRFIHTVSGRDTIRRFTESSSMAEQRAIYLHDIEPRLFSPFVRALPAAIAGVCGMHWRQVSSTLRYGRFLLQSVCRDRLRHVMTSFPIRDNYYWHQMLTGEYASPSQCPPYLQRRYFSPLRDLIDRVDNRHGDVIAQLRGVPPATFTKANLLDMPDFLSPARRLELFREIRRVCAPGARVLYRSFAPDAAVPAKCESDSHSELRCDSQLSRALTLAERTASYGGVHLYTRDRARRAVTAAGLERMDRLPAARDSLLV